MKKNCIALCIIALSSSHAWAGFTSNAEKTAKNATDNIVKLSGFCTGDQQKLHEGQLTGKEGFPKATKDGKNESTIYEYTVFYNCESLTTENELNEQRTYTVKLERYSRTGYWGTEKALAIKSVTEFDN